MTMRECLLLSLTCDYGQYGRVASLVPECGGVTDDTVFEEKVTVGFSVGTELLGTFRKKLADATNGQVDDRAEKNFLNLKNKRSNFAVCGVYNTMRAKIQAFCSELCP